MALAIGSLPVLLLETQRHRLPHADRVFIDGVNVVVLVAFAVDYIAEISVASNRRLYVRSEYLSLLIVVSQALTLVPSLAAFGLLRTLRAARLLRVVAIAIRAAAIGGSASRDGRRMIREHAASFALGMAALTWLTSAAAFTVAEDVGVDALVTAKISQFLVRPEAADR